jgi:CubicO group peptidase (beta-lactamase class C family)
MTIAFPQEETRATTPSRFSVESDRLTTDNQPLTTDSPSPRPISPKKLAANRANAKKSTGPRTQKGKAKVAQNARTHGLSSQQAPDFTNDTFFQAHEEFKEEHHPITPTQSTLVREIAHIVWKLDQIPKIEFQLLNTPLPGSDLSLPTPPAHNPYPLSAIPPVIAAHFLENAPTPLTRIYNHQLRLQSKLTSLLHHLREAKKAHQKQQAIDNQIESDRERSRRLAKDKAIFDEELERAHQKRKQKEEQDRAQRLQRILDEKPQQKQTHVAPAATQPHPTPAPAQIKPTNPTLNPQKPTFPTPPAQIKPTTSLLLVFLILSALCASAVNPAFAQHTPTAKIPPMDSLPQTQALLQTGIDQKLHIGLQLHVSLANNPIADIAIGLARPATHPEGALEMTPDTLTLWLSSGKPITAAAVAQLWEKNLLDLDDPVARFIPEFASFGKDTITLRHLLTHTAPLRLADTGWPHQIWEQIMRRIRVSRPEPRWINGITAGYSAHITWYLLGEIVQRLSNQTLGDYLRENIFNPLGMNNTFLSMTPAQQTENASRLAIMQVTEKDPPADLGTESPAALASPRPSGSIRGPIRELAHFYQALLNRDNSILTPQTIEAMTARHRVNTLDKTFHAIIDWGLGFMINSNIYGNPTTPYQFGPHASRRAFGHSGNQSSVAFADPHYHLVAALVFNGLPGEARHQTRVREVLTALYQDLKLGI